MNNKFLHSLVMVVFLLLMSGALADAHVVPSNGWGLHIDGKLHVAGNSNMVVHHYCKTGIAGGLIECQLYDSDKPNARLMGVEVIVPAASYQKLSASEKALWHYHKEEIPKASITLPDLPPAEAAKVAKSLEETYGKIYLLWDPTANSLPLGQPSAYADSTRAGK